MRRGVAQPIPPPPLPFCRAVRLVVILWVDVVAGLALVCELLAPGGRPGPRLGVGAALLLEPIGPGFAPVAAWSWIRGGDWVWDWDWVPAGLWVRLWVWGACHP